MTQDLHPTVMTMYNTTREEIEPRPWLGYIGFNGVTWILSLSDVWIWRLRHVKQCLPRYCGNATADTQQRHTTKIFEWCDKGWTGMQLILNSRDTFRGFVFPERICTFIYMEFLKICICNDTPGPAITPTSNYLYINKIKTNKPFTGSWVLPLVRSTSIHKAELTLL